MSLLQLLYDYLVFFLLLLGLGLPWVVRLAFGVAEKLALAAGAGTLVIYLYAWLVYWMDFHPARAFFLLPALAAVGIFARWRSCSAFVRDPTVRSLGGRQLLFSAWCVAAVALVRSYSGGEWAGDWYEHYERALFFLNHAPLDTKLLSVYLVPSRPPLANLADGALMAQLGTDFATYQVINTLFSTLAFLPAALLMRHFARKSGGDDAVLLLTMMCSPLIIENATFAWTKLLTVYFIVLSVAFFVRGWSDVSPLRRTIAMVAAGTAIVTHYSAGPYVVALVGAQFWRCWVYRHERSPWRELFLQATLGTAVLATWFAWSLKNYGARGTFLSNTTAIVDATNSLRTGLGIRVWNTFITFVPHLFRPADLSVIAQSSWAGYVRDYWFNIYQTTVPGAFGFAGVLLLVRRLVRPFSAVLSAQETRFWWWFILSVGGMGIASASWRDRWGVVHICLVGLILMGIAWLAARFDEFPRAIRQWWLAMLGFDLFLGLGLQFWMQANAGLTAALLIASTQQRIPPLGPGTIMNLALKVYSRTTFLADQGPSPHWLVLILALLLLAALWPVIRPTPVAPNQP